MLVARRDSIHPDAHEAAYLQGADLDRRAAPRFNRTLGILQIVGSLLAIPVGIASAYSFYRANFSVETTCQGLRANIIAMIDKRLDASTRRILVGRDVEAFEQSCGNVDPDATAAFKVLLKTDKTPASGMAAAVPAAPTAQRVDAPPKPAVRKVESRPQQTASLPAEAWPAAAGARRDPAASDAQWVDAVRAALLAHGAERPAAETAQAPVAPVPASPPAKQETALPASAPVVIAPAAAPVEASAAPALPPAVTVGSQAAPQAAPDHPVPPGAIPDTVDTAAAKPDERDHSRVHRWIAKIPLMGSAINKVW
ncbi:MAG TPA: hypothetical protein VGF53_09605 [Pseudolabrys sp.]|jgi:hypothetical protein